MRSRKAAEAESNEELARHDVTDFEDRLKGLPPDQHSGELSARAAAELLNVSDSYLDELLGEGTLPCQKVRNERRIRLDDLLAYKRRDLARRRKNLSELTAEAQEMGLYD